MNDSNAGNFIIQRVLLGLVPVMINLILIVNFWKT